MSHQYISMILLEAKIKEEFTYLQLDISIHNFFIIWCIIFHIFLIILWWWNNDQDVFHRPPLPLPVLYLLQHIVCTGSNIKVHHCVRLDNASNTFKYIENLLWEYECKWIFNPIIIFVIIQMSEKILIECTCTQEYPDKRLDNPQHLGQKIERQGNYCDPNHIEYYLSLVWSTNSRDNKIHLYQSLPM